ncbi:MAG: hypothetical protein EOO07_16490 [Chitinophagaceae bacterium]|nr:MAG: hypothetical protein EOO07_16490 [Chitinophagaceae bacterium]
MQSQGATPFIGSSDYKLSLLTQRVELLEEKIFKKVKRNRATEAQRFLLYHLSGSINHIIQNSEYSQKQKALLVSLMLDIDPENARKFISELAKKEKPLLNTESNYTYLVDVFQREGFKGLEEKAEKTLLEILSKKGK